MFLFFIFTVEEKRKKKKKKEKPYVEADVGVSRVELSKLVGVSDLDNLQLLNAPDFESAKRT